MDLIHHEVQEGQLCAQHCLNTLLQCPVFDALQLAAIAQQLDSEENKRMAEGSNEEYSKFLQQPSCNMDDSGFFSVQVIMKALEVYGLSAKHWKHPDLKEARKYPIENFSAFICNLNQHWFTIRKIGLQWFNIDSCKSGPTLVSDTYLEVYLKQIELEGYTVFVVLGNLPYCQADEVLASAPLDPSLYNTTKSRKKNRSKESKPALPEVKTESVEDIRRKRLAKFCGESSSGIINEANKESSSGIVNEANKEPSSTGKTTSSSVRKEFTLTQEESDLDRAIAMSLQHS